jgi:hypothetical protein
VKIVTGTPLVCSKCDNDAFSVISESSDGTLQVRCSKCRATYIEKGYKVDP